ncbi:hypothetical protein B0A52_09577 [Exophiala mesophila]|uniref:RRM domain-containing protein n=1 Tax=Exophiala mesophila TaxID=212818 RepID=A0A438MT62_EXOME|nr:hypothetical protein B0A52_09577 [Exophiala mesophila]
MSNSSKGRSGGVLPVNAAARKTPTPAAAAKPSSRNPAPKSRLIIRRLPPGLTETEFWNCLGQAWKVGAGKIDWAAFKEGKISNDPAKPSRPSRAYLKVKDQSLLEELSVVVKQSSFLDAKNTSKDASLLGPPSLEFAPYNKTPSGRIRHDGRQGTIDQDQEFIDFLQSLTEPITKGAANGTDAADVKADKVSTTPLIQYIKEKKANKAKEASQAKATKSREAKEAKVSKSESRSTVIVKGKNNPPADKEKVAKATQDAVKAVNKSVAAAQVGKQTSTKSDSKQSSKETPAQATSSTKRERERGSANAAARMLQRDLGLVAKENKTQRERASKAGATNSTGAESSASSKATGSTKPTTETLTEKKEKNKDSVPATPTTPTPPTGPRASRTTSAASTATSTKAANATPAQRTTKPAAQPTQGAKSAFLKHANASQGITEEALQTSFKEFGTITRCEIDKKKGLAYIDFGDAEALKKAMAASPVKVGSGQVTVLENKNSQGGGKRGGGQQKQKGEGGKGTNIESKAARPSSADPTQAAASKTADSTAPSTPSNSGILPEATSTTSTAAAAAGIEAPGSKAQGRGGGRGGKGAGSSNSNKGSARGSGQGGKGGNRGGKGRRGGQGGQGGGDAGSNADSSATPAASSGGPSATSATSAG